MSSRAKYKTTVDRLYNNDTSHIWKASIDTLTERDRVEEAFEQKGYPCHITTDVGKDKQYYNCIEVAKGYVPLDPIIDFLGSQRIDMEIHYQKTIVVILGNHTIKKLITTHKKVLMNFQKY